MVASLQRIAVTLGVALAIAAHASGQNFPERSTSVQRNSPTTEFSSSRVSTFASASPQAVASVRSSASKPVRDFGESDLKQNERDFLGSSLIRQNKTPFMSESTLPLAQAFGSLLRMEFVMMSVSNKNLLMGPLAPLQSTEAFAHARTGDFYGVSLSVPFGRDA